MLFPGDLGFRFAVFFIFGVFPAGFFILRRKWRVAVARQEEINRLLVLASEEAARAELEANFGYNYTPYTSSSAYTSSSVPVPVPVPAPAQRLCAVCFTPTPNRCARCKSVNYWYVCSSPPFLILSICWIFCVFFSAGIFGQFENLWILSVWKFIELVKITG